MGARKDLIGKLRAFRDAAHELATAWSDQPSCSDIDLALTRNYPFHRCFVELAEQVGWWVEDAIERLGGE